MSFIYRRMNQPKDSIGTLKTELEKSLLQIQVLSIMVLNVERRKIVVAK